MTDRTTLLNKKQALEDRLGKIKRDMAHRLSADSEERAIELENHDVLLEIARVTEAEIAAINEELNGAND